ncbi:MULTISPECIES: copper-binding protein [Novosphingobium]|uniref:Copper-binding protein n=1 Tax=Novosphingobium mangrovi (ex Huang et al. 2023) TaxID=2976432 RepID=A0ABT2I5M9_9SPHN|nr:MULTISPECIES: copper-binding protein [Novosphingobium]MCT2400124.1 copper-binding protein [Novosphingobium mangrovi (ex Huang et al. 2023)]CCA93120.1 conserved hypothetical protein [Novosphingobium sp. PP1Y]
MKVMYSLIILGPALLLAACGQKAKETPAGSTSTSEPAVQSMGAMGQAMGSNSGTMPMSSAQMPAMASGMGMVTAVDPKDGTVTIKHGPIPAANWPAMTMMFTADPKLLETVKPGDNVSFDLKVKGDGGEVTAIRKQ